MNLEHYFCCEFQQLEIRDIQMTSSICKAGGFAMSETALVWCNWGLENSSRMHLHFLTISWGEQLEVLQKKDPWMSGDLLQVLPIHKNLLCPLSPQWDGPTAPERSGLNSCELFVHENVRCGHGEGKWSTARDNMEKYQSLLERTQNLWPT